MNEVDGIASAVHKRPQNKTCVKCGSPMEKQHWNSKWINDCLYNLVMYRCANCFSGFLRPEMCTDEWGYPMTRRKEANNDNN